MFNLFKKKESEFILNKNIEYRGYTINLWVKKPVASDYGRHRNIISCDAGWNIVEYGGGYYTNSSPDSLDTWLEQCEKDAKEKVDSIIELPGKLQSITSRLEQKFA